ncbi:MAG: YbhB/YbcL family Raf kinase inhibitor-like protein [Gemmatimonadaceae bacterium]
MHTRFPVALAAILGAAFASSPFAPSAFAQQAPPATEVGASLLALANVPSKDGATLTVTSPAFTSRGDIPFENTQYRGNIFPGLAWSAGPAGTKAYVVVVQDGDAMSHGAPIFHWSMLNISASVTQLPAAMTAPPAGAEYGPNIRGAAQSYMGPHTPPGPRHRYHFQVFALDAPVADPAPANYAALADALKGHVLASGEIVGLGRAPDSPAP